MVTFMLWKRVLTAALGIPFLIYSSYRGGIVFLLTIMILTVLGLFEFHKLVVKAGCKTPMVLLWLSGLLIPYFYQYQTDIVNIILFIYVLLSFIYFVINYPSFSPVDLSLNLLAVIYVVFGFSHLLLLRMLPEGFRLVIYAFIIIWSTDTGAYFAGLNLGKHKLAPRISPNKTWEGVIAGLLSSFLGVALLIFLVPLEMGKSLLIAAPFVSLAGQVGDLFESSLKRYANTKDSGWIIPGHGGVLDRFDSTLWAVPTLYYLIVSLERL